jgi:hypothetical protein
MVRGRSALSWSFGAGTGSTCTPKLPSKLLAWCMVADMGYDRAAALAGTVRESIYL